MNVAVVGGGAFGIPAALELRRRGREVTVFEQGAIPYEKSSTYDVSKTVRRLYWDHAVYTELAERADVQWRAWAEMFGREIYQLVGQYHILTNYGPGRRIWQSVAYLNARGAGVETFGPDEARRRFPQFAYGADDTCVYDRFGGYVASTRALQALAELARGQGVALRPHTKVHALEETPGGVAVRIDGGAPTFDRALVATGAWLGRLAPAIAEFVRPTRQEVIFLRPADPDRIFEPGPAPAWAVDSDIIGWYGHFVADGRYVKVANDLVGESWRAGMGRVPPQRVAMPGPADSEPVGVDPDSHRDYSDAFAEAARAFVATRIPALAGAELMGGRSCLYENTPDHDLVIDWSPGSSRVLVAGGGSGHGFKFGGSIGPVLADLLEGKDNPLARPFKADRLFALA